MGLDTRYILAPVFQSFFIDKDTALPLAAGKISFFSDVNRNIPKNVYQISGSPPNYIYTSLGSVLTLSAVGTFVDGSNNDIVPYLYPYDAAGNIELYYITGVSAGGAPQFTREGQPNIAATGSSSQTVFNYIPNGQFLLHFDIPATSTTSAGTITQPVTILGPGGISFERPVGSTATDIVTFDRFGSPIDNPTGNPRYAFTLNTQIPDGTDTFKDLRIKFRNVNKFASESQFYTFSFTAKTNNGTTENVAVNLIKNFGTGGSIQTTTAIQTFTITPTETIYNASFIFGVNDGKTIGLLNDDFVALAITFPLAVASTISVTDAVLTPGQVIITQFPATTDADFISRSIAGWAPTPAPDGSDLYCPLVLTPSGVTYSHADIGKIFSAVYTTSNVGELSCDAASYVTKSYSTDGIPYSRLQAVLWDDAVKLPRFGTGAANLSAYLADLSPASTLRISTNQPSTAITNAANGALSPGFTISTIHAAGNYALNAYVNGTNTVVAIGTIAGAVTAPTAGNSGFTVTDTLNQANRKHVFQIQTTAASTITAGHYFTFVNTTTTYYVWFKINGSGVDPAPGGTGIEVDLLSTYTAAEVAHIVREAMSGFQITTIITVAASAMTAGCYFTINTLGTSYVVYYTIDGVGNNPNVPGTTAIPVALAGTDTAAIVASKTQVAVNSTWFATPPFNQGYFLKGLDPNSVNTYDAANRYGLLSTLFGNQLGTFELDQFLLHHHDQVHSTIAEDQSLNSPGGIGVKVGGITGDTGGNETRPVNAYVNFVIKY